MIAQAWLSWPLAEAGSRVGPEAGTRLRSRASTAAFSGFGAGSGDAAARLPRLAPATAAASLTAEPRPQVVMGVSVFVYSFVAIIMFTLLQARMHDDEIGQEGRRKAKREGGRKRRGSGVGTREEGERVRKGGRERGRREGGREGSREGVRLGI